MKILFINGVVDYGSTGKIVRDLANASKKQGHEVLICYGRNEAIWPEDTFNFASKLSFTAHYFMSRIFGRNGLHSNVPTRRLLKTIEEFNPDIINLHNLHGYYINLKILFNYLKNRPHIKIIMTLHDCWWMSGSSAYYSFDGCKEWEEGCLVVNNPKSYPVNQFGLRQKKNFHMKVDLLSSLTNLQIITPSIWLKEECSKTYLRKYNVKCIYNGIDLTKFKIGNEYENFSKSKDKIQLLGVANIWEKRKGLADFLELSKRLPSNYHITLVGLSKDQISNLPSNITGVERTNSFDELVNYYKHSDIYLNLSYEETLGMTTIESLACGTPVVVYDQTAVPEVIDETCGIISKAGDIDLLINNILSFDFQKFTEKRCINRALLFDKNKMVSEYLKMYEGIYEKN